MVFHNVHLQSAIYLNAYNCSFNKAFRLKRQNLGLGDSLDVFDAIKTRRSVRGYTKKSVEKKKLLKVLEAARLAPSAANRQPWNFVVVTDAKIKESLKSAYNRDWFISAPVIIVGCANPNNGWTKEGEEY
jgi:nitroreductase